MARHPNNLVLVGASSLAVLGLLAVLLATSPAAAEGIDLYEFKEVTTDHGASAVAVRADGAEAVVLVNAASNNSSAPYTNIVYTTTGAALTERARFVNQSWYWTCAAFDPSSNKALLGGTRGMLYMYEGGQVNEVENGVRYYFSHVEWHPRNGVAYLATTVDYIYEYRTGSISRLTRASNIYDMSMHPDGGSIAVADYNNLRVYNLTLGSWSTIDAPVDDQGDDYYRVYSVDYGIEGKSVLASWRSRWGDYDVLRYSIENDNWVYIGGTSGRVEQIEQEVEGTFGLLGLSGASFQYYQGGSVSTVPGWHATGSRYVYDMDYDVKDFSFLIATDDAVWRFKRKPNVEPWLENPIPDVHFNEDEPGGGDNLVDLLNYVRDDRAFEKLRFEFVLQEDEEFLVGTVDGTNLDFQQRVEHWYGRLRFQLKVYDRGYDDVEGSVDDRSNLTNVFNVTVKPVNDPVTIVSLGDRTVGEDELVWFVDEGERLNLSLKTHDVDDRPPGAQPPQFTFNRSLPTMRVDTATMTLTFVPRNRDVGTIRINLTASDGSGSSHHANLMFHVRNVNNPPQLLGVRDRTVLEDHELNITLSARDKDLEIGMPDVLTFSTNVTDGVGDDDLPNFGFVKDEEDPARIIVWFLPTNEDVGVITVEFRVRDGSAPLGTWQDIRVMRITVVNTNDVPVLTYVNGASTSGLEEFQVTATEDEEMSVTLVSHDDDRDPLTYYVDDSRFSLSQPGGGYEARVTFTPTNDDVGITGVTVSVWDAFNAFDELVLNVTITNVNDPPVIQLFEAHEVTGVDELEFTLHEDMLFTAPIVVVDIDSAIISFSDSEHLFAFEGVPSDPHRAWANLTPSQHLVGTVQTTIQVDDGHGGQDALNLVLTVRNVNDGPVAPTVTQLGLELEAIPLRAEGAKDPDGDELTYTWDFGDHSGTESGVNLTDVTHVYPRPGIYRLTLTVTDGNGGSAVAHLDVSVPDQGEGTGETEVEPGPVGLVAVLIVCFAVLTAVLLLLYWRLPRQEE